MSILIVAAYASVRSLLQVLDNPTCRRLSPNTIWIQTLHEMLSSVIGSLENYSVTNDGNIEDLAKQIAEVANEAENIIDFHVVDLLRDEQKFTSKLYEESEGDDICIDPSSFCQDMDKIIEKINHIKDELLAMVQDHKEALKEKLPRISLPSTAGSLSVPLPSVANNPIVVGLDDHVVRIMDQLTGNQTHLRIIPIVGMGGIGKTTLAHKIFEHKCVVEHFDVRIWITISQQYSMHETLLRALHDVGVTTGDLKCETLVELGKRLHQKLFGKRYLIVMDDLWSTNAWDEFKFFFSDNNDQKSRILVTTRMLDVADYVGSCESYVMNLLDDDQSWKLLCEKVFRQESCSTNLEGIGKRIAKGCRGLPLALVAVGGLLANCEMTKEHWELVARNVNSFVNSEKDDHCLKVLHLSYNHLPIHLKPCFLYMSVFPEDCEVRVSELIRLWIAEGFIKPIKDKEWEEVAKEYLKDLIDRNLIYIRKQGSTGKVKTCGIHDLLRDLCVRETHNKLFFGIPKVQRINLGNDDEIQCFLCAERQQEEMKWIFVIRLNSRSTSSVSVLACEGCSIMYSNLSSTLRVVKAVKIEFDEGSMEFLQPTKLRYFSWCYSYEDQVTYPSLHLLWNLQILNIDLSSCDEKVLPSEIWEMTQLRHIYMRRNIFILLDEFERCHYSEEPTDSFNHISFQLY